MEIKGCVGLVTGGNRGIGEAFVRVLLESGAAKVYAASRDPAGAAHFAGVSWPLRRPPNSTSPTRPKSKPRLATAVT
jgi:NAD(P)-dependent dehydrogenase (short-subunit alcohol dehydrogenase family)